MSENIEEKVDEIEEEVDEEIIIDDDESGEEEQEEIIVEKKSFFEKMKDPKYTKHKILLVVVLLCVIGGLGYYVYSSLNWTSEKICRALVDNHTNLQLVVLEENTNPSISYFNDNLIKKEGIYYTGMIEVFANKTEALLKKDYYQLYDQEMMASFNETTLGTELNKIYGANQWTVYVNGNTLIRISYLYSDYQVQQLIKNFNTVMDGVYQTEKNIPTEEKQKEIQKNYQKQVQKEVKAKTDELVASIEATLTTLKAEAELDDTDIDRLLEIKEEAAKYKVFASVSLKALEVEETVDGKIKAKVDAIDQKLDDAEANHSRDMIQEAKDAIALLTHEIFTEYKDPWNKRIEQILYKIKEKEIQDYKDQCQEFNYYDIDDSYKGEYAYFYGKIDGISTNDQGRIALIVNTTPKYLFGQIAYWTNPVYVDVDNGVPSFYEHGGFIHMWGTIEGMLVNEQVFGDAKSYPTFYCQYASN